MSRRKPRRGKHLRPRRCLVGLPRPSTVSGLPAGTRLTAREREIARLLSRGLTNKEIARQLRISQRTADSHVQNMLNKLGASNRAQIVALAGETDVAADDVPSPATAPSTSPSQGRRISFAAATTFVAGMLIMVLLLSADRQAGVVEKLAGTSTAEKTNTVIDDAFDGSLIDAATWTVQGSRSVEVYETGRLIFHVGADAPNAFVDGLFTVCRARGDFDAQVSYDLAMWPRLNALWVELGASGTPFGTYVTSRDYTTNYGVYFPPVGMEVEATASHGSLRLTRVGSKWTGYYLDGDHWSLLASGEGPPEDVGLNLVVANDQPPFGGRETLVYLRNFRLTADHLVCP